MDTFKKKYNEALERARTLKEKYPEDAAGYEIIFPELRESEDEMTRQSLIDLVNYHFSGEERDAALSYFETGLLPEHIAWLKSLRPSWKPSEEQMEELLNALTPGKDFDCDVLFELYKQLKKLM